MKRLIKISMIPKTTFFKNVRSSVSPRKWDRLRRECYSKANYRCEICYGKGPKHPVECHEVWSYNHKTSVQKLKRLISLCPACHQVKHFGLSKIRGLERDCIKHMIKVNDWSEEQVLTHIAEAVRIWNKRNSVLWTLDMSYLDTI